MIDEFMITDEEIDLEKMKLKSLFYKNRGMIIDFFMVAFGITNYNHEHAK